ncbi:MAG TPA: diaminopimelate decarboxylase [Mycobacteriales bacterium]|nr:diaminopimelate decarboxylase [Mycobacteriales bacterium]
MTSSALSTGDLAAARDAVLSLCPVGADLDEDGSLRIGGIPVDELASTYGTPAYVVDEDALLAQAGRFRTALTAAWPRSRVVFASKAFPCTAGYRTLSAAGLAIEVSGGGELAAALAGGVTPADIVMQGNAKTDEELELALDAGVGTIVVDNFDDIDRLERRVVDTQRVLLRVIPGVRGETHDAMSTGQAGSKFGLAAADAERAIAMLRTSDRLYLAGVHMHIGSQICATEPFVAAVEALSRFGEFDTYDLGGGLGARYTYADAPPGVEDWVSALVAAARRCLPAEAEILIEPGRRLVARSGVTLYRVVSVKGHQPTFVAVDGGMGDNLDVSLYGQRFEATLAHRVGGGEPVELVGRHCESGDVISHAVPLRDPKVGDIVVVPVTGAYCYTMSNNYNGARRPPVVFCRGGEARLVVRRETYEDLLRRDQ